MVAGLAIKHVSKYAGSKSFLTPNSKDGASNSDSYKRQQEEKKSTQMSAASATTATSNIQLKQSKAPGSTKASLYQY